MQKLIVLIFENETGAQEMISHVQTLQRQQLITISDAAVIIRQQDEKVKVKQVNSLVGSGVLGGAFWGLLIGQYFWMPRNTESETYDTNKVSDCGIDADFLKQVGSTINPGYSALFMLVAYMTEEILDVLAGYSDTLLYTTLSGESDAKLREAFGIVE